ncbi:hypothetical protein A0H81_03845 [Grifola frondosa]|uniref:Uncharacterized protein n=1 Tax=Grifola frondosa TaxID=5627 RepID=A0A1C7MQ88_GRIFR|nr:hypothetical protein A0H81_03845 [Grifola frondosa]
MRTQLCSCLRPLLRLQCRCERGIHLRGTTTYLGSRLYHAVGCKHTVANRRRTYVLEHFVLSVLIAEVLSDIMYK